MQKKILVAFILLISSSLFWSGNFFTGKVASMYGLTPFKLSFFRWLLAFLILFPFTYRAILNDIKIYKENLLLMIVVSILGVTIFNSFTYISLQTTMVINSSLMASITPLLIIGFSWFLFKTKTTSFQFIGIFLSLLGAFCIISKGNLENFFNLYFTKGDIWMLVAVFCWGLYSVLLKKIDKSLSQLPTLEVMIFLGLIFISPFYFIESLTNDFLPKNKIEIFMIMYVALFAGIISFFAWNKGVSIIGPNRASLFLHLIPVFSSIWAISFLEEKFALFHLFGAVFIVIGIILANISKKKYE